MGGPAARATDETDAVEKQAERALTSAAKKLDNSLSVSHDVNELIAQATDVGNLAKIYHGQLAVFLVCSEGRNLT